MRLGVYRCRVGDQVQTWSVSLVDGKPVIGEMVAQVEAIKGLGDLVKAATDAVGIKPCGGCGRRREALNRILPFGDNRVQDL